MANTRSVKLAGPYKRLGINGGKPFYKVITTRNNLIVRPGEYYTEGAIRAGLLSRTNMEVNFVEPKKAGFPSTEKIHAELVLDQIL